ncbi:hypothetical protein ACWIGW_44420 [Nocardia brasiliensis]
MTTDHDTDAGWIRLMREVLSGEEFDAAGPPSEWACNYNGPMTAREASQITQEHRTHPADTCRVKARALGVLEAQGRRVADSARPRYGAAVAHLADPAQPRYGAPVAHLRRKRR